MKKFTIYGLAIAMSFPLVTGCATPNKAFQQSLKPPVQQEEKKFQETPNTHMLQSMEHDVYGDNNKEKIILYAEQNKSGMPVSWSLVVNGIEKVKLTSVEGGLYSFAQVKFVDVDGDHDDEVLLYRQSSGSAGALGLNIYKPTAKDWQLLFAIENPFGLSSQSDNSSSQRYEVKYLGNYYASFEDKKTGLKSTITLDKAKYKGMEDMLKNISTWVDPVVDYIIVDPDGDGIKDIITIQRVIGVAHADTLALLKTTYKLQNGKYKAITLTLTDEKDKPLQEVRL